MIMSTDLVRHLLSKPKTINRIQHKAKQPKSIIIFMNSTIIFHESMRINYAIKHHLPLLNPEKVLKLLKLPCFTVTK